MTLYIHTKITVSEGRVIKKWQQFFAYPSSIVAYKKSHFIYLFTTMKWRNALWCSIRKERARQYIFQMIHFLPFFILLVPQGFKVLFPLGKH